MRFSRKGIGGSNPLVSAQEVQFYKRTEKKLKKVTALFTAILFWISIFVGSASADQYSDGRTDAMSFWFDPDMSPGETFASYFGKKQYRYIYKEAVVSQTTNSTY